MTLMCKNPHEDSRDEMQNRHCPSEREEGSRDFRWIVDATQTCDLLIHLAERPPSHSLEFEDKECHFGTGN